MARQRNVYPTSEVPHLWAHQTQVSARNPQGNLFFEGRTIYSYRTSWPLATIYEKHKGAMRRSSVSGRGPLLDSTVRAAMSDAGVLVLTNCDRYGNTTAKHQGAVNRAVNHLPAIAVPNPCIGTNASECHADNLAHLLSAAANGLSKAKRVMTASNVRWRREHAEGNVADARTYCAHFGIRRKIPDFPAAEWDAALARAQAIESPDPVRDAKRFKARERRHELERQALRADFDHHCAAIAAWNVAVEKAREGLPDASAEWRATGAWPARLNVGGYPPNLYGKPGRRLRQAFSAEWPATLSAHVGRDGNTLLRVNGNQIETSQGARIPLDHAPRIWALVQACRNTGRPYTRNGHTEHAGQYAIDAVDTDGTLRAGCHSIKYAELELMARTLGYVVAP